MLISEQKHKNFNSKIYTNYSRGYEISIRAKNGLVIPPLYGTHFGSYMTLKSANEKLDRLIKELDSL